MSNNFLTIENLKQYDKLVDKKIRKADVELQDAPEEEEEEATEETFTPVLSDYLGLHYDGEPTSLEQLKELGMDVLYVPSEFSETGFVIDAEAGAEAEVSDPWIEQEPSYFGDQQKILSIQGLANIGIREKDHSKQVFIIRRALEYSNNSYEPDRYDFAGFSFKFNGKDIDASYMDYHTYNFDESDNQYHHIHIRDYFVALPQGRTESSDNLLNIYWESVE